MANQLTSLSQAALTIVELEERFEMTAAAVDTTKCDNNTVKVEVPVLAAA